MNEFREINLATTMALFRHQLCLPVNRKKTSGAVDAVENEVKDTTAIYPEIHLWDSFFYFILFYFILIYFVLFQFTFFDCFLFQ